MNSIQINFWNGSLAGFVDLLLWQFYSNNCLKNRSLSFTCRMTAARTLWLGVSAFEGETKQTTKLVYVIPEDLMLIIPLRIRLVALPG
jgi:hypothetical protein